MFALLLAGCVADPCASLSEPEHTSQDTAELVQVEDASKLHVAGGLFATAPAAWFTYHAKAGWFHTIDPRVEVGTSGLVACAYMTCSFGACPGGTSGQLAPNGQPGCCGPTPVDFQIHGCGASSVDVYMSVASPGQLPANACVAYTLDYNW